MELGNFLCQLKTWIESESKLHYGKFKHNPHALHEGTDSTKRRIVEYWRKIQMERYGFETGAAGKIILRSKIGRTTKLTVPIINFIMNT